MTKRVTVIFALSLFWGCAELDHAGDVVLREMSSINVENPRTTPDMGALPGEWGEPLDEGNP